MIRACVVAGFLACGVAGAALASPTPDPSGAGGKIVRSSDHLQVARVRHRRQSHPTTYVIPGAGPSSIPIPPAPAPLRSPATGPETFSDRAVRCTHHGGSFGLPQSQMGAYVHNCAMQ